jgi:hypothetical protein
MNSRTYILSLVLISGMVTLFDGCKSDDDGTPSEAQPILLSFTPTSGIVNDEVVIAGTNFSEAIASNFVKFNGIEAEVVEASENELTVLVPSDATTGTISVTVGDATGTSSTAFTIPTPLVVDVTPILGGEGLPVIITGENFSPDPSLNIVKFNGTVTEVVTASASALEVTVPAGATTGKITVDVGANKGTSPVDFEVCNNAELLITSATATATGTGIDYAITIRNVGKETINLSQWTNQNYVSIDNIYDFGDQGGGGQQLDLWGSLATGEQTTITTSVGLANSSSYNYFIVNIMVKNAQTVTECHVDNNNIIIPID